MARRIDEGLRRPGVGLAGRSPLTDAFENMSRQVFLGRHGCGSGEAEDETGDAGEGPSVYVDAKAPGTALARVTGTISKVLGRQFPCVKKGKEDGGVGEGRAAALRTAMERGTVLDNDIEEFVWGRPVYVGKGSNEADGDGAAVLGEDDVRRRRELALFCAFWDSHRGFGLEIRGTQVRVASRARGLCGTADVVAEVVDAGWARRELPGFLDAEEGDIVIIDLKRTGRSNLSAPFSMAEPSTTPGLEHVLCDAFHTYRLQLTAYRALANETYAGVDGWRDVKPNALFLFAFCHREDKWKVRREKAWDSVFDEICRRHLQCA